MSEEQKAITEKARTILEDSKKTPEVKAVITDKQVIKESASQLGATDKEIAFLEKTLSDSSKTEKALDRLDPDKRKKPPTMKDQLVSALLLMTPQLIGMGIGSAVAGTEGMIAGQQGALEGQKLAADMEKQALELEQKKRELGNDDDNLTTAEKIRYTQNLADHKLRVSNKKRLEKQEKARQRDRVRGLDLREESMRALTPAQQEKMSILISMNSTLGEMEDIIDGKDPDTGEFIGAAKDLALRYGLSNDMDHTALMSKAALVLAQNLKEHSGTAVNEGEVARWEGILMTAKDRPDMFRRKLQEFRNFLRGKAAVVQQLSIDSGQYKVDNPKRPTNAPHPFDQYGKKKKANTPKNRVKDKGLDFTKISDKELDDKLKELQNKLSE